MVLEKNDQQQRQTGGEGVAVQQQSCLMIVPPKAEHAENGVGPHSTCSSSSGDQQHGYANGHAVPLARSASAGAPMTKDLDYLAQLLKDKKQLSAFPNVFGHVERLVDEEINRVRVAIFQCEFTGEPLQLPEPMGEVTVHQKKVFVPVKQYPEYNFVGRILGPRGMTAKQLETETGCKIMVRGKGSMRDKKKEEANRGKPNWEHLAEELHVIIQCEDTQNRAELKIARAVEEVNKLMVPAPEGEDELKKKQLMELAILNGTFRNSATASVASSATQSIVHTPNGIGIMVGKADVGGTPLLQLDHQHLLGYSAAAPMTNSSGLAGSPLIMPSAGAVKANPIAQSLVNNPLAAAQALALQQLAAPNTASTVAQLFGVSAAVPYGLATSSAVDYQQQLLALGQLQQQQQQHSQFDSAQLSLLLQQQQIAFD